jgi:hypothetical protein
MPRPSLPGPIGPDYTKPGRALPSQPRTPDRSRGALNTEAVTMSVTDLTPKRSRWRVTGFWHQPRLKRARRFFSQRSLFFIRAVYVCVGYSLFLELSSRRARKATNIDTRTPRDDKMAYTLQTPADKPSGSSLRNRKPADKTDASGSSLRRRKPVDKTDASGSRMRTQGADKRPAGATPRRRNHSMGDGTWRNRKRRSHRNEQPAHNRKRRTPKPAKPPTQDPRLRPPSLHTS